MGGVRSAYRAAVVALTGTVALLVPVAAHAGSAEDEIAREGSLSTGEWLLWVIGLPLAVAAVLVAVVLGASAARGQRYRPGLTWWAEPAWVNGPEQPDRAVEAAVPTQGGGGARARW